MEKIGTKQNKGDSMKIIGITGGVGAGKSMVLAYIKAHYKCRICMADDVAKEIQLPGGICYDAIVHLLGEEILDENGFIQKNEMAKRIFQDRALLEKVNAIVHPGVRTYLENACREELKKGEIELFFIEAALLIENGYCSFVDEMWYVYADETVRENRLKISRGYTEDKIKQIMSCQLSEEEFRNHSQFILDNSNDFSETEKQIKTKLEDYTWLE